MTKESSKTGGPDGLILTLGLSRMINSQLSTLTAIQENLMDGLQQVTSLTKELHGLKLLLEDGTSSIGLIQDPLKPPPEWMFNQVPDMSSFPLPEVMYGEESPDRLGILRYDPLEGRSLLFSAEMVRRGFPRTVENVLHFLVVPPTSPKIT